MLKSVELNYEMVFCFRFCTDNCCCDLLINATNKFPQLGWQNILICHKTSREEACFLYRWWFRGKKWTLKSISIFVNEHKHRNNKTRLPTNWRQCEEENWESWLADFAVGVHTIRSYRDSSMLQIIINHNESNSTMSAVRVEESLTFWWRREWLPISVTIYNMF